MMPAAVGTPRTEWQAMHGAVLNMVAPRVTSPVTDWSKARLAGVGVFGFTHSGRLARGKGADIVSESFFTGVGAAAAAAGAGAWLAVPVSACAMAGAGGALPIALVFW